MWPDTANDQSLCSLIMVDANIPSIQYKMRVILSRTTFSGQI